MVFSCSSSTPVLSYVAVAVGIGFWPLRGKMRAVRWVLLIGLIVCHIAMKAPVWFLIAHLDIVAGNSGYHRAELIDTFVRHFSDWWLCGTNKAATWGFDMDDLCEQWVAEGETGGLATFVCFILLLSRSFGRIGKARRRILQELKARMVAVVARGGAIFALCWFLRHQLLRSDTIRMVRSHRHHLDGHHSETCGGHAAEAGLVNDTDPYGESSEEMILVGALHR